MIEVAQKQSESFDPEMSERAQVPIIQKSQIMRYQAIEKKNTDCQPLRRQPSRVELTQ